MHRCKRLLKNQRYNSSINHIKLNVFSSREAFPPSAINILTNALLTNKKVLHCFCNLPQAHSVFCASRWNGPGKITTTTWVHPTVWGWPREMRRERSLCGMLSAALPIVRYRSTPNLSRVRILNRPTVLALTECFQLTTWVGNDSCSPAKKNCWAVALLLGVCFHYCRTCRCAPCLHPRHPCPLLSCSLSLSDLEWLWNQDASRDLLLAVHPPNYIVLWNGDTGTKLWKKSYAENILSFSFDPFDPSNMACRLMKSCPSSIQFSTSWYKAIFLDLLLLFCKAKYACPRFCKLF